MIFPGAVGPNGRQLVAANSIISQTDNRLVESLDDLDLIQMQARYQQAFGPGIRPALDQDPTANQLVCLRALLREGRATYCGFAIRGPLWWPH